jgi:hypothetical protein
MPETPIADISTQPPNEPPPAVVGSRDANPSLFTGEPGTVNDPRSPAAPIQSNPPESQPGENFRPPYPVTGQRPDYEGPAGQGQPGGSTITTNPRPLIPGIHAGTGATVPPPGTGMSVNGMPVTIPEHEFDKEGNPIYPDSPEHSLNQPRRNRVIKADGTVEYTDETDEQRTYREAQLKAFNDKKAAADRAAQGSGDTLVDAVALILAMMESTVNLSGVNQDRISRMREKFHTEYPDAQL